MSSEPYILRVHKLAVRLVKQNDGATVYEIGSLMQCTRFASPEEAHASAIQYGLRDFDIYNSWASKVVRPTKPAATEGGIPRIISPPEPTVRRKRHRRPSPNRPGHKRRGK